MVRIIVMVRITARQFWQYSELHGQYSGPHWRCQTTLVPFPATLTAVWMTLAVFLTTLAEFCTTLTVFRTTLWAVH